MPVLKVIVPKQFLDYLAYEADRQASNASEVVRGYIREHYLAYTTVVEKGQQARAFADAKAATKRPVGRPAKRKAPRIGPPPPGVTVSMEPSVKHTIKWERGGPELWDAYGENFYSWLDDQYPYDLETETRADPPDVSDADLDRYWAS